MTLRCRRKNLEVVVCILIDRIRETRLTKIQGILGSDSQPQGESIIFIISWYLWVEASQEQNSFNREYLTQDWKL